MTTKVILPDGTTYIRGELIELYLTPNNILVKRYKLLMSHEIHTGGEECDTPGVEWVESCSLEKDVNSINFRKI